MFDINGSLCSVLSLALGKRTTNTTLRLRLNMLLPTDVTVILLMAGAETISAVIVGVFVLVILSLCLLEFDYLMRLNGFAPIYQ